MVKILKFIYPADISKVDDRIQFALKLQIIGGKQYNITIYQMKRKKELHQLNFGFCNVIPTPKPPVKDLYFYYKAFISATSRGIDQNVEKGVKVTV